MTSNTNSTSSFVNQPLFGQRDYAWMIATFVITPLTASALAIAGYIPTDPMTAAIDGLLVSFMYVGFRVINAWKRLQTYKKALAKKSADGQMTE